MANERTKYVFAGGDDLSPLGRERGQGGLFRRTAQDAGDTWQRLPNAKSPATACCARDTQEAEESAEEAV